MSRTARLLELLIRLPAKPRFTVEELVGEFAVSRRTMLRDLHALSELGIPLIATPGPGGGYALAHGQQLPPLRLTVEEALGLLLSYEAFIDRSPSPFADQSLSAVTKLRAALPTDLVAELDHIRRHVAILDRPRPYAAPLLGELLRASIDGVHLRTVYDSRAGRSERVIFPFGLYSASGFWYCACLDDARGHNVSLRADRFVCITCVEGRTRPTHIPLSAWLAVVERDDGTGLPLRLRVTARGIMNFTMQTLFGRIEADSGGGGCVKEMIPRAEIGWYAAQLLSVGADITVESPPELIAEIRRQAEAIAALYTLTPIQGEE